MKTTIDTEVTEVKFLLERNELGQTVENQVWAYFPNDIFSYDYSFGKKVAFMTSYAHVGQHSACHPNYAKSCEEATMEQYQDLKAELESIGYKLQVLNKK